MTVAIDTAFRGWPSHSTAATTLEDKYEIVKEIGDGSFGSVALGRTRSAGAHIVRRNTMVSLFDVTDCKTASHTASGGNQDDEKDFRVFLAVYGASRSHLSKDTSQSPTSGSSLRDLSGSTESEATYRDGVHGWQPLSIDESSGS